MSFVFAIVFSTLFFYQNCAPVGGGTTVDNPLNRPDPEKPILNVNLSAYASAPSSIRTCVSGLSIEVNEFSEAVDEYITEVDELNLLTIGETTWNLITVGSITRLIFDATVRGFPVDFDSAGTMLASLNIPLGRYSNPVVTNSANCGDDISSVEEASIQIENDFGELKSEVFFAMSDSVSVDITEANSEASAEIDIVDFVAGMVNLPTDEALDEYLAPSITGTNGLQFSSDGVFTYVMENTLGMLIAIENSTGLRRIVSGSYLGEGPGFRYFSGLILEPGDLTALTLDKNQMRIIRIDLISGNRVSLVDLNPEDRFFPISITARADHQSLYILYRSNHQITEYHVKELNLSTLEQSDLYESMGADLDFGLFPQIMYGSFQNRLYFGITRRGTSFNSMDLDSGTVSNQEIVGTPSGSRGRILMPPSSNVMYVANTSGEEIFEINVSTGARRIISNNLGVGTGPALENVFHVTLSNDHQKIIGVMTWVGKVVEVDIATGDRRIISSTESGGDGPTMSSPRGLAMDFESDTIFTRDASGGFLFEIDGESGDRVRDFTMNSTAHLAFSPTSGYLYSLVSADMGLQRADLNTNLVTDIPRCVLPDEQRTIDVGPPVGTITVGTNYGTMTTGDLVIRNDSDFGYYTVGFYSQAPVYEYVAMVEFNFQSMTCEVKTLDWSNVTRPSVNVRGFQSMVLSPDGSHLYGNYRDFVYKIPTDTYVMEQISGEDSTTGLPIGSGPEFIGVTYGMAIHPDGDRLYISSADSENLRFEIVELDLQTLERTVISTDDLQYGIPAGRLSDLVFDENRNRLIGVGPAGVIIEINIESGLKLIHSK